MSISGGTRARSVPSGPLWRPGEHGLPQEEQSGEGAREMARGQPGGTAESRYQGQAIRRQLRATPKRVTSRFYQLLS